MRFPFLSIAELEGFFRCSVLVGRCASSRFLSNCSHVANMRGLVDRRRGSKVSTSSFIGVPRADRAVPKTNDGKGSSCKIPSGLFGSKMSFASKETGRVGCFLQDET